MNEDIKTTLVKYITGQADETESAEIKQWIKSSPENEELYFQLYEAWHQSLEANNSIDVDAAYSSFADNVINRKPLVRRLSFGLRAAAAVIAVPVCLMALYKVLHTQPKEVLKVVHVPKGAPKKLIMPDGTIVWLNAGSELKYSEAFGKDNRTVYLTGEAYFDIAKSNKNIPFLVKTDKFTIRDVGTVFNVKAYPNEKTTETSLLRGRVEITFDKRPGEKWILKPNEKLILNNDPEKLEKTSIDKKSEPVYVMGNITRTLDSTILETSWVENKLIFQDESFADIAKKMERWYGVNIVFKDQTVADYHLYGSFTTETINEALDALKTTGSKFTYKIEGQNVTIAK